MAVGEVINVTPTYRDLHPIECPWKHPDTCKFCDNVNCPYSNKIKEN